MNPPATHVAPSLQSPASGTTTSARGAAAQPFWRSDTAVYLAITALVLSAWWVSTRGWYTSWSRTGYWLGVAGGVTMLFLFTYPLRKRWKVTYNWGATKSWFVVHMVLGVLGPWLILLHSTFSIGSTNAAVALYSMIAVALSGVIGRFLFMRLNSDMRSERANLNQTRQALMALFKQVDHDTQALPPVLGPLNDFEDECLGNRGQPLPTHFAAMVTLPSHRRKIERQAKDDLQVALKKVTAAQHWSKPQTMEQYRQLREALLGYTQGVQRAAQYQTFERLFSLWHLAHVPFVWILVLCAIFHVVAVHAY
jgi:hypothetical protein